MRRLVLLLLPLATAASAQSSAPFTVAESGKTFGRLQDAVFEIGDGTGTIVIAPGTWRQCATQERGNVTYRAATPGTAILEAQLCEGKAGLVLRGKSARVEGIVFRGYRVGDGNGAGIRSEGGDLAIANAMFLDSQEGILGNVDGPQRITIDRSTFSGLGQCDESPSCAHSIYLANNGSVTVTHSRFEHGHGGHYVKVRTPRVTITDNSFDDTGGSKTNYMIDLPNGATGTITGNTFVQGKQKENGSAMIAVSAEGKDFSAAGLRIADNDARLAPGATSSPAFVADWSRERLAIGTNTLGKGIKPFELR